MDSTTPSIQSVFPKQHMQEKKKKRRKVCLFSRVFTEYMRTETEDYLNLLLQYILSLNTSENFLLLHFYCSKKYGGLDPKSFSLMLSRITPKGYLQAYLINFTHSRESEKFWVLNRILA